LWNSQQIYPKGKADPGTGDPDNQLPVKWSSAVFMNNMLENTYKEAAVA